MEASGELAYLPIKSLGGREPRRVTTVVSSSGLGTKKSEEKGKKKINGDF